MVKPPIHVKVRDAGRAVHQNPAPRKVKEKTPEVEHMEMEDVDEVAAKLSSQLYIEDIDVVDRSNPQLCAEYVKDIYEYMMRLEVRMCCHCVVWVSKHLRFHVAEKVSRFTHIHDLSAKNKLQNESHTYRLAHTSPPPFHPPSRDPLPHSFNFGSISSSEFSSSIK